MKRAAIYARVSTSEQQTIAHQARELRALAKRQGWKVTRAVHDVASGAKTRPMREELMMRARRRELDVILVWKLDRWGRSLVDLVSTLAELDELGVRFVSLTEAIDFGTSSGRALAGMLAVFAAFERDMIRERVRAGIANARRKGTRLGRPPKPRAERAKVVELARVKRLSVRRIAKRLGMGATTVRRILAAV